MRNKTKADLIGFAGYLLTGWILLAALEASKFAESPRMFRLGAFTLAALVMSLRDNKRDKLIQKDWESRQR